MEKQKAREWFMNLRNTICDAFEKVEKSMNSNASFERKKWERNGGGVGEMSLMKGRVFDEGWCKYLNCI